MNMENYGTSLVKLDSSIKLLRNWDKKYQNGTLSERDNQKYAYMLTMWLIYRYMKTLGISNLDPSIFDYAHIVQNSDATKYIKRLDTVRIMDPSVLRRAAILDQNTLNFDLTSNLGRGSDREIGAK